MCSSYLEYKKNRQFFHDHLTHVGIDPERIVMGDLPTLPLHQALRSGYGKAVVNLWVIGYTRSKEGMLAHEQSA